MAARFSISLPSRTRPTSPANSIPSPARRCGGRRWVWAIYFNPVLLAKLDERDDLIQG